MMLTYPWPENVVVTIDDVNEKARVTVAIPRRFPFRDKILAVVNESVAVAQQIAWVEYIYTLGTCNHIFVADSDGIPGAAQCTRCLSRFDNVLVDPALLAQPDIPLTVQDILDEIDAAKTTLAQPRAVFSTCDDHGNRKPHLAIDPVRCDCHGYASFNPGSIWDAINAFNEIAEPLDEDDLTEEEIDDAIDRVTVMLNRKDITLIARVFLHWTNRRLHSYQQ